MSDWFESWFGEDYIALYPHRDDSEAAIAVATVARIIGDQPVRRVLDLACGAGRHARHLAKHWLTFGLDLSEVLLRAAKRESAPALFVRGDMRALPFRDDSFDLVTNFFTSFGYFDDDNEHRVVVREVARVSAENGLFVLDYLNAFQLRRTLVPYDERRIGDSVVEQHREITSDGCCVVKTIKIRGDERQFVERVRLYTPEELMSLVSAEGFEIESVIGDYNGGPLTPDSLRAIIIARRR
ncbi:MAG TPA: class I SAM-dependent methyltransferase [Gemmatimonadaceae bacterium]